MVNKGRHVNLTSIWVLRTPNTGRNMLYTFSLFITDKVNWMILLYSSTTTTLPRKPYGPLTGRGPWVSSNYYSLVSSLSYFTCKTTNNLLWKHFCFYFSNENILLFAIFLYMLLWLLPSTKTLTSSMSTYNFTI